MIVQQHAGEIPVSAVSEMTAIMDRCFGLDDRVPNFAALVQQKPHPMALIASADDRPVGFKLGFERSPGVFSSWLGGVVPEFRRQGIARELMRRQHSWCGKNGYHTVLTESTNAFRSMLILNLQEGFRIAGTQYSFRNERLGILLTKDLREAPGDD